MNLYYWRKYLICEFLWSPWFLPQQPCRWFTRQFSYGGAIWGVPLKNLHIKGHLAPYPPISTKISTTLRRNMNTQTLLIIDPATAGSFFFWGSQLGLTYCSPFCLLSANTQLTTSCWCLLHHVIFFSQLVETKTWPKKKFGAQCLTSTMLVVSMPDVWFTVCFVATNWWKKVFNATWNIK